MSSPYKTVALHTFGCKANFADTSLLSTTFNEIGYNIVSFNSIADIYMINIEASSIAITMKLADEIRKNLGVAVYIDSLRRSLKSQMRHANKMNAQFAIICDLDELKKEKVIIKNMKKNTIVRIRSWN